MLNAIEFTSHPFGVVAVLQPRSSSGKKKKKKESSLQLRTVIRRGVNGGKVIEETFGHFASQQKDEWFHNIYRKITIFTI